MYNFRAYSYKKYNRQTIYFMKISFMLINSMIYQNYNVIIKMINLHKYYAIINIKIEYLFMKYIKY